MQTQSRSIADPRKGKTIPLGTEDVTIGRSHGNTLWINSHLISRRHCLVRCMHPLLTVGKEAAKVRHTAGCSYAPQPGAYRLASARLEYPIESRRGKEVEFSGSNQIHGRLDDDAR